MTLEYRMLNSVATLSVKDIAELISNALSEREKLVGKEQFEKEMMEAIEDYVEKHPIIRPDGTFDLLQMRKYWLAEYYLKQHAPTPPDN